MKIAEIQVRYHPLHSSKPKIINSSTAYEILKSIWDVDTLEYQEQFYTLYLNRNKRVLGYRVNSIGGVAGTVVDVKQVIGLALKCNASGILVSHNHPSGNKNPSEMDRIITRKLKQGCAYFDIELLDHLILTNDGYYSMADEGLLGNELK